MSRKADTRRSGWFRRAFSPLDAEQEIDEEIAHHLAMRIAENEASGMSPEAARAEALRRFGSVPDIRETALRMDRRLARRGRLRARVERTIGSLLHASRSLRRDPAFTLSVVAILALGIGAATTVFAVVDGAALRPLSYPAQDRLMKLVHPVPGLPEGELPGTSTGAYAVFREHQSSFTDLALYAWGVQTMRDGEAFRVTMAVSTPNLPALLGVSPVLGRAMSPIEPATVFGDEMMLSHEFWMTHYAGDSTVVGRRVEFNGGAVRIVGVLAPDETRVNVDVHPDVWLAMNVDAALRPTWHLAWAIGRLRDGVDREAARRDFERLIDRLPEGEPDVFPSDWLDRSGYSVEVVPLRPGPDETDWAIFGSGLLLLFACCANVANLLLARRESRRHETAIRGAMGAGRWDLLGDDVAEAALLAAAAVAVGLVGARLSIPVLVGWIAPTGFPRLDMIAFGMPSVVFAFLAAGATALLVGLIGAFRRSPNAAMLRDAWKGAAITRPASVRHFTLAGGQVALALIIAIGAGLAMRSAQNILATDPGVRTEGVLTFEVHLMASTPEGSATFYRTLFSELESLPAIRTVGAVNSLPLGGDLVSADCTPLSASASGGTDIPCVSVYAAAPGFTESLSMPLRGAPLTWNEPGTAIVTAQLAARLWPGQDAIGKTLLLGTRGSPYRITGVLEALRPHIYDPPAEVIVVSVLGPAGAPTRLSYGAVVVRTTAADPLSILPDVRRVISRVDPSVAISNVRTMDDVALAVTRRYTVMLSILGFAAISCLLLSAVGVFGVVAHIARRRTREIGIRIALGAAMADVRRAVAGRVFQFTAIGAAIGLAVAMAATRVLGAMLYGVKPVDPPVFAAVTLLVCTTSFLAGWIPARRASLMDPVDALRSD